MGGGGGGAGGELSLALCCLGKKGLTAEMRL